MNDKTVAAAAGRGQIALLILVAACAVPGVGLSQQTPSLMVDVGPCVGLQSPGERLDCYERQVQRARAQPAPAAAPAPPAASPPAAAAPPSTAAPPAAAARVPPAAAPQAAPPVARNDDGNRQTRRDARVEEARIAAGAESEGDKLEGTITALRERVPNAWLITLDNGQVWRQDYPEPFRLAVGQRVRVEREDRFGGGYRLYVVGRSGNIQVEPVR
jgi:hypothetical protein